MLISVDELLLNGAIKPLYESINSGRSWIREDLFNTPVQQMFFKLSPEFSAIVGLDTLNRFAIFFLELIEESNHQST